jgi:hypothetical protein
MWRAVPINPVFAVFGVIAVSLCSVQSLAQTGTDRWRQEPQAIKPADDVAPKLRAARNEFFDRVYGPPPRGWFSDGPDIGPILEEV